MEDRNGLTSNLAEVYFCAAYKVFRMNERGYDTIVKGNTVQIKGGLVTTGQTGTLLGYSGQDTTEKPFDYLAVIEFALDYKVLNGVVISYEKLHELVSYNSRSEGYFLTFSQELWRAGTIITGNLRQAARELNQLGAVPEEYRKPKKSKRGVRTSDLHRGFIPETILIKGNRGNSEQVD